MAQRGVTLDDVPALVRRLRLGSETEQRQALAALFPLLASENTRAPTVAAIAVGGGVPALVRLLESRCDTAAQGSAASLLAFITDGAERVQAAIAAGAIPPLVRLMRSGSEPEQQALTHAAAHALAELAAYSDAARVAAFSSGAVAPAVRLLASGDPQSTEAAACLLGNLVRDCVPLARAATDAGAVPPLVRCLRHSDT